MLSSHIRRDRQSRCRQRKREVGCPEYNLRTTDYVNGHWVGVYYIVFIQIYFAIITFSMMIIVLKMMSIEHSIYEIL